MLRLRLKEISFCLHYTFFSSRRSRCWLRNMSALHSSPAPLYYLIVMELLLQAIKFAYIFLLGP